ncbi:hypothetical protein HIM_08806 [Hirsutella minnesotensis 3608]|uniref:Uncharacterized protein n=1 Tax=Hirsutella minnesotensis 3608 TaxID=1043627 RepID=A0A0F7ZH02_9HYPO|nr:hypothetical protein HIM_08806 [Hirsutella minnesotensis 3608]
MYAFAYSGKYVQRREGKESRAVRGGNATGPASDLSAAGFLAVPDAGRRTRARTEKENDLRRRNSHLSLPLRASARAVRGLFSRRPNGEAIPAHLTSLSVLTPAVGASRSRQRRPMPTFSTPRSRATHTPHLQRRTAGPSPASREEGGTSSVLSLGSR